MNDINPVTKALGHLFWPNQMTPRPAGAPTDWLRFARWGAAALTVLATGIQVIVWLMICMVTQSVEEPWWLWTAVPGLAVTGFLSWMLATREQLGIEPSTTTDHDQPVPSPLG